MQQWGTREDYNDGPGDSPAASGHCGTVRDRHRANAFAAVLLIAGLSIVMSAQQGPTHYVRYERAGTTSFGVLDGETVRELSGDIFQDPELTGNTFELAEVTLLVPLDWTKVRKIIGIGANGGPPPPAEREPITHPILFAKFPQGLVSDGSEIESFPEMTRLIFEGELVLVIGKEARHVAVADAPSYIFGVAVGNDVSENDWWGAGATGRLGTRVPGVILAKALDTFSGIGTSIVSGLDYSQLRLTVKKNGKLVADGNTNSFYNNPAQIVSYLSRYITLFPGDLIYMGCFCYGRDVYAPDQRLYVGDRLETELENVGALRQTVIAAKAPPAPDHSTSK